MEMKQNLSANRFDALLTASVLFFIFFPSLVLNFSKVALDPNVQIVSEVMAQSCPSGYQSCSVGATSCQKDANGNNTGYVCVCQDLTTPGCSPSPYTVRNCNTFDKGKCPVSGPAPTSAVSYCSGDSCNVGNDFSSSCYVNHYYSNNKDDSTVTVPLKTAVVSSTFSKNCGAEQIDVSCGGEPRQVTRRYQTNCGDGTNPPPPTPAPVCETSCEMIYDECRQGSNCGGTQGAKCGVDTKGRDKFLCTYRKCTTTCTTPSPSTPTPTPTPAVVGSCEDVKAYTSAWVLHTPATLATLTAQNQVYFCARGSTNLGTFTKAQFTINGILRPEVTTPRPGTTNEFCELYTIPGNTYNFLVSAKVYHSTLGWIQ